jgi:hypothetical protein
MNGSGNSETAKFIAQLLAIVKSYNLSNEKAKLSGLCSANDFEHIDENKPKSRSCGVGII